MTHTHNAKNAPGDGAATPHATEGVQPTTHAQEIVMTKSNPNPDSPHRCNHNWCGFGGSNEIDHWQPATYVPGRLSVTHIEYPGTGATLPTVGIGALTIDGAPAVYVHIDGAGHDAQADLTLADARRLRDQLEQAILNAEEL